MNNMSNFASATTEYAITFAKKQAALGKAEAALRGPDNYLWLVEGVDSDVLASWNDEDIRHHIRSHAGNVYEFTYDGDDQRFETLTFDEFLAACDFEESVGAVSEVAETARESDEERGVYRRDMDEQPIVQIKQADGLWSVSTPIVTLGAENVKAPLTEAQARAVAKAYVTGWNGVGQSPFFALLEELGLPSMRDSKTE